MTAHSSTPWGQMAHDMEKAQAGLQSLLGTLAAVSRVQLETSTRLCAAMVKITAAVEELTRRTIHTPRGVN